MNLDRSSGGLGKVALTDYGSYASSPQVEQNASPGYDRTKYAIPAAPGADVTPTTAQPHRDVRHGRAPA